jgi:hypothetical protein
MSQVFRFTSRSFSLLLIVGFILLTVGTIVLAQQSDGRVNPNTHVGGDALYCVDENYAPTLQLPLTEGGFRLLNKNGQELWFVPAADVAAALAIATPGGSPVLIAAEAGSYGATELYTYKGGAGEVYFVFIGFDEHGKSNSLTFRSCVPGRAPAPIPTPTEEVTLEPLICSDPNTETMIPCDECPNGYDSELLECFLESG